MDCISVLACGKQRLNISCCHLLLPVPMLMIFSVGLLAGMGLGTGLIGQFGNSCLLVHLTDSILACSCCNGIIRLGAAGFPGNLATEMHWKATEKQDAAGPDSSAGYRLDFRILQ